MAYREDKDHNRDHGRQQKSYGDSQQGGERDENNRQGRSYHGLHHTTAKALLAATAAGIKSGAAATRGVTTHPINLSQATTISGETLRAPCAEVEMWSGGTCSACTENARPSPKEKAYTFDANAI